MPKHINTRRRIVGVKNGLVALLFLAAYSLSAAMPFMPVSRVAADPAPKVFVCKYVGKPGVDERLQTGQNPISVSVNAIPNYQGIGSYFADAQGRSYVLVLDTGQPEPPVSQCPAPQGPTKIQVPATPSVTDPCGSNNATWNKPADTTSLDWSLSYSGKLTVTTKTGYVFDDGTTYHDYGYAQDSGTPCLTPVQPTAPTVKNDACGTQTDTYTIPSKTGVQYYVGGNPVSAGTYPTNGALQVNVTAKATQGYVLTGQSSWTLTFTNVPCIVPVQAAAPTVATDPCGKNNDTYTIPATEGVKYYVNGQYKTAGTYSTGSALSVNITATAQTGYILVGDSSWTLQFTNKPCLIPVEAEKPTIKQDPCGTENDKYVIPYVKGVDYFVNGVYKAPGTYSTNGKTVIKITVEAQKGYKLVGDDDCWTLKFDDKPCLIVVVPQPPTQVPVCGANNDEVDVPEIPGVIYKTFWKGDTLIVKAMPAPGYVFPHESEEDDGYSFVQQISRYNEYQHDEYEHEHWDWVWKFVDENTPCPAEVTVPVNPTVVCGPNNDVVVLPTVEHVTYTQTGWVNGENTVTATADEGYYIAGTEGETSVEWTFTDSNTSCGHVLGDTTPTPTTPQVQAAELENTGASTALVTYMSLTVLGLAVLTFLQNSKRKIAFVPVRVQRGLDRVRGVLAQPFMIP